MLLFVEKKIDFSLFSEYLNSVLCTARSGTSVLMKKEEEMLELKSMTVKAALVLSMAAFALTANTASAVDVPVSTGTTQVNGAMSEVLSSPAVKSVMISQRDQIMADKINAKPLINDLMPKIETAMMPVVKEQILPEKMAGLQNEMAKKIAPQF